MATRSAARPLPRLHAPNTTAQLRRYAACVLAFALVSVAYSLATWGMAPAWQRVPNVNIGLALHIAGHLGFGALVALSLRRLDLILLTTALSLLVDIDHLGTVLGWPTVFRSGHSIGFLLLGPAVLGLLARRYDFGLRPRTVASLTAAAILAHLAWDTLSAPGVPIFLPFSVDVLPLNTPIGALLEVLGVAATWIASAGERPRNRAAAYATARS